MTVIEAREALKDLLERPSLLISKQAPLYAQLCARLVDALEVLRYTHEERDEIHLRRLAHTIKPVLPLWSTFLYAVVDDIVKAND